MTKDELISLGLKWCYKCKIIKSKGSFCTNNKTKDKLNASCRRCSKEYQKIYRLNNIEKLLQDKRKYYYDHREERLQYRKYYSMENKEKIALYQKEYSKNNKEKLRVIHKRWVENNNERYNELQRKYLNTNINLKISKRLNGRLRHALKNNMKPLKTLELLGCSIEYFIEHIKIQFQEGMSWNNYGHDTWHIDHIKPCSSYDLSNLKEQKLCFHYTNMQPLWAKDNLIKHNKIMEN